VAISTTWMTSKREVFPLAKLVRRWLPEAFIVLGGPLVLNSHLLWQRRGTDYDTAGPAADYFFLGPAAAEESKDIDLFVVEQQGERELVEVCRRLRDARDPRETANCAFYSGQEPVFTRRGEEPVPLEAIDWGALPGHLVPEIVPLRLSTGCPFRCSFCNFVHRKRTMRKSKEAIRQELRSLARLERVKFLRIVDDTMGPGDFRDFCAAMEEERCGLPWTTFARADALKPGVPETLRRANCRSVQIGIESCDDGVLRAMNKRATAEMYRRTLGELAQAGIGTRATLIMGHPGETAQSIENTVKFLNELKYEGPGSFEFAFAPFFLLPLSPIYEPEARRHYGLEGYMQNWRHATMSSEDVPRRMVDAFMAIGDRVFFVYVGDDVMPAMPPGTVKRIKAARQKARKLQLAARLSGQPPGGDFARLMDELRHLCVPESREARLAGVLNSGGGEPPCEPA
jgi:anaerobic magnesium-protoporphyrin IX monomethyl ester cyclase